MTRGGSRSRWQGRWSQWLTMRRSLTVAATGLTIGTGLALVAARTLESQLFNVAPQDPLIATMAVGFLLLVASMASWLPARRSATVDPASVLRDE